MKMATMRNRVRAGVLLTLSMVVALLLVMTNATPAAIAGDRDRQGQQPRRAVGRLYWLKLRSGSTHSHSAPAASLLP